MHYNFDELIDRRGTDCYKWRTCDEDVIPMGIADMDFVSPQPVMRALQERVAHGVFGYPESLLGKPDEALPVRMVIVERLQRLYSWQVKPEEIVFIPGVVTGFNLACHALAQSDGGVLVSPPVYDPILAAPKQAGMRHQEAPLIRGADGNYEIDFDAFEAAITPQTVLFILCNPHNPVGRVYRQEELIRLAEICLRHQVPICSDEIHCDLVYSGQRHIPIAALDPEIARSTITLMAPSKTFNLAGLNFSFAIIPDANLRKRYQRARKGLVGWVNIMGWTAALAAYCEGQEWLEQLLVYLEGNRDFLAEVVRGELPGISMAKPQGTYLAWLDCRAAGIQAGAEFSASPQAFFLKHARVDLKAGETYGKGGEGFLRLNFGCPRSLLGEALERMKAALTHT